MRVFVTGATGFVGSRLVRALLARGIAVRGSARSGADLSNLQGLDIDLVEADLLIPSSFETAFSGCQGLYHVAADYRLWVPEPRAMYSANVEGTKAVMRAAMTQGVERIVYCSSVAVLGRNTDGAPADETTTASLADMIGHYKRSKFLAEQAVGNLIAKEGLPCVIVNPSTPIGPNDIKPTPTGRMILEAARGNMPAFVDTGLNIVHVDDVAGGHMLAFDKGRVGERYILGGENLSLADILTLVAKAVDRKPPSIRLPHNLVLPLAFAVEAWARLSGQEKEPFVTVDGVNMAKKAMYFNASKARSELGFKARPAAQAITDAVRWFSDHGYFK